MAKQTIIDWQHDSLLVATTSGRPSGFTIDAVSFQPISDSGENASKTAKAALEKAVAELGLGKGNVTLVAARGDVEVRTIRVPRVEPNELPDIIRFQAQRQLANMSDNWALDYVLLPDDGQEMLTALVGALAPDQLRKMEAACGEFNLQIEHIALRPIEIARHAAASGALSTTKASLLVCMSEEFADLIITKAGQVVLLRNTKLPTDSQQVPSVISGEIRRSLLAASNQLGSTEVENITLMAAVALAKQVEQAISDAAGVAVKIVDPTDVLSPKLDGRERIARQEGNRIAGICGAAGLAHADKKTIVDFKHPKRRPPKKNRSKQYLLAGAASALIVLAGTSWWIKTNRDLDSELEFLTADLEAKGALVAIADEKVRELALIEQFAKASPNFLDEFLYLSERIPDASKVILAAPQFTTTNDGYGQIRVNIGADRAGSIREFEQSLRDENHDVDAKAPHESEVPTELYRWESTETILIKNLGWNLVENLSTTQTPAANTAEAKPADQTEQIKTPEKPEDRESPAATDPEKQA